MIDRRRTFLRMRVGVRRSRRATCRMRLAIFRGTERRATGPFAVVTVAGVVAARLSEPDAAGMPRYVAASRANMPLGR